MLPLHRGWAIWMVLGVLLFCNIVSSQPPNTSKGKAPRVHSDTSRTIRRRQHDPISPIVSHTQDPNHHNGLPTTEQNKPHVTHGSESHGHGEVKNHGHGEANNQGHGEAKSHEHVEGKHHARPKQHREDSDELEENHFFSDFAPHGSIFFYMFTTITATLNICASSAVIYISYVDYQEIKYRNREKTKKPHLSSSIRFPFYIAILDLFLGCITLFMVADTMYWDELPSSRTCAIVGGIIYLGTFIEMTVVGTVAIVTYLQLVRKVDVYLGKWDWKVWVGCGLSCLGTAIAGIHTRGFGPDLYW
ncbi:hypothetical protein K493DRAFT_72019 [Basidiobolus meristosporus CBS 931.73]|uniref:G-protein coupled receptors family 1 profile domain-containing protein n=1 Tax=Basidiobolus meristosporus CBS 931.73 TaxID=1314790 RepID=A0A1Y1XTF7_9FUNG|nr:hypothetical protein K493DRAFT_72019 [Basidiobolus meristosporus CBS 931.73]|eukprot:ORX89057.1 hypothetical protein K493DRAFT_72019 [Basidiobolus meristosporus CBS 931.73]